MVQAVVSARIASHCPIAPLKNAILLMLIPITICKILKTKTIAFKLLTTGKIDIIKALNNKLKIILYSKMSLRFGVKIKEKYMQENLHNQNIPTIQPQPIDNQYENKKKQWIKISFFVLLGFILLSGVFYAGIKFNNIREQNNKLPPSITQTPPEGPPTGKTEIPTVSQAIGIVTNKVFYSKDNNIFSYDTKTKETIKWTNDAKNKSSSPAYDETGKQIPNIEIKDIRVIDENTLGFGKCGIVTGNFGCGLYTLDLKTKEVNEKKKIDSNMLILALDFASPNKFAYLVTADQKWQVFLFENATLKTLEDLTIETYGRGGFIEDSEKIRFSKDGKYVLQISTSSPRNPSDFNIYVYDLTSGSKQVISGATQPEWLDNKIIVYRKYEKNGDGLYLYNVDTKNQEKINGVDNASYNPTVLTGTNKVIYTLYPNKQIWFYDFNTKKNSKISDSSLNGFWVTPTKIVYEEIELCNGKEGCGGMVDYEVKSVNIFDLESSAKIDLISDIKSTYGVTSEYR